MRKNMYERRLESLETQLAAAKYEVERAAKIWARVSDISRDDLYVLEALLNDELHDEE